MNCLHHQDVQFAVAECSRQGKANLLSADNVDICPTSEALNWFGMAWLMYMLQQDATRLLYPRICLDVVFGKHMQASSNICNSKKKKQIQRPETKKMNSTFINSEYIDYVLEKKQHIASDMSINMLFSIDMWIHVDLCWFHFRH